MSKLRFLCGVSGLALALGIAASPASAQLADVAIEGPIQSIDPSASGLEFGGWTGEMVVMGATIRVRNGAEIHTPTNPAVTLNDLAYGPLEGRTGDGFIGGTAIVTGDSVAGIIYANDVFSDFAENVIVGEATAIVEETDGSDTIRRATINNMIIQAAKDPRMPAGPPINGFGFEIDPTNLANGSLVAAEGYFASGRLYYHTLEADGGALLDPLSPQVSVLRASCRKRGGGRDELEVRGGTVNPANARVRIQYSLNGSTWTNVNPVVTPVVDATVTPSQGLYRYNQSNLTLPGTVCPPQIRAIMNNTEIASAPFTPDSR